MEGRSGGWIEVNGEDILGKKLVDKSIFRHGTTLPKDEVYKYFNAINRNELQRGENEVITLLADGKEFKALFRNVKSDKRDDTYQFLFRKEIKNYIREKLPKSYKYIFQHNEDPNIERPQEYIEFYKIDRQNTFRVELIADNSYKFNEEENEHNKTLEKDNRLLKEDFFKYIGTKEESINRNYQKSYKIVLLIALLELSDFEGKAVYEDICSYIRDIYIERYKQGFTAETSDSEIQRSIDNLSIKIVRDVMNQNPYNVISEKGYILKEYVDEVEYLSFNKELWSELTDEDKEELKDILKYKLNNYYLERNLGNMNFIWDSTSKFLDNMEEAAAAKEEETNKLEAAILKKLSNLEESNFESKDVIKYIHDYIAAKGYEYSIDIIKNLYLSLRTKPFVILYGISGTGKSKLVELFAEAIGATREDGTYNLIPVRPDWSDASELIGYRNIESKFQPGILTNIIKEAVKHKEIPYFVCLDEMNLARVEYYFSDILSIMETRDKKDEEIKTDKLIKSELFGGDLEATESFGDLYIPENLYIIGTVNMDETTFPFSKKVLDRANTIEFNEVNLDYNFDREEDELPPKICSNKFLLSKYIKIAQCKEKKNIAKDVIEELNKINQILRKCDMQFAYRVRDEVVFYIIYAVHEEIMDFDKALDYAIKQKILPRIGGSSEEIEKCLLELFIYCSKMNKSTFTSDYIDEDILKKMSKYLEEEKKKPKEGSEEKSVCKYPISSKKILKMLWRFNKDGFTTFW